MTDVAVLTPDPADPSYAGQWPGVLERLAAALKGADVTARPTPWTEHVEDVSGLAGYPLILPLITWGYHRDHDRWMQASGTWEGAALPVANPASVLAWNSDKAYLDRLAERGVATPETRWLDGVTQADVDAATESWGGPVIVKPRVSGGAWKTLKLQPGETLTDPPAGPAMIQPFLPAIVSEGELSLLFFGGRFSHAVRKIPVGGDFRIQVQFGGQYRAETPPDAAMTLAEQALAAVEEPLLYARVDMVRDAAGQWLLMELELIEPDFYLGSDPDGGAGFARAVRERLG